MMNNMHPSIWTQLACYQNNTFRCIISLFLEPVKLLGEGKYNLNALKQIETTDSYFGLSQEQRGCQDEESLDGCTTRQYVDTLLDQCGCLPLNIHLSDTVIFFLIIKVWYLVQDCTVYRDLQQKLNHCLFVGASLHHPTAGLCSEYKSEGSRGPVPGPLLRPHPYQLLKI